MVLQCVFHPFGHNRLHVVHYGYIDSTSIKKLMRFLQSLHSLDKLSPRVKRIEIERYPQPININRLMGVQSMVDFILVSCYYCCIECF